MSDCILEIGSEGEWNISISRLTPLTATCGNKISGNADTVTGIFNGTGKKEVVKITFNTTSYQCVQLYTYSETGTRLSWDLLVNDSGEVYVGEVLGKMDANKQYFFVIESEGEWTITFGDGSKATRYENGVKK